MTRLPARSLHVLVALCAATACYDRPNAAPAASKEAHAATGSEGMGDSASGVTAVSATPAADAGATAGAEPSRDAGGEDPLPKRSHRDSVALASMTKPDPVLDKKWPVSMPAPLPGAVLPAKRIVAYYGNPLVKRMGVLGEYPRDEMLKRLDREVARWAKADPSRPVIPALHMVVTVASDQPGRNGLYRTQMFDTLTNMVYGWAKSRKGLFFVDVQVGRSTVMAELPRLKHFLENPDVHLALDPEFAMAPSGAVPGRKIGTLDAKDINWAVDFLDEIARTKNLPPKILIVHRFTRGMVTNASKIRFTPHVQVVMDMDGWGPPWLKFDSYHDYVKAEPVQFTGFKLFYHNDTKKGDPLLTPAEVLRLNPRPLYIQYQ
jgi:hypothetical protein